MPADCVQVQFKRGHIEPKRTEFKHQCRKLFDVCRQVRHDLLGQVVALHILDPGWREFQGFENFTDIAGNERIRTPFLRIFVWNVVFAVSVVLVKSQARP